MDNLNLFFNPIIIGISVTIILIAILAVLTSPFLNKLKMGRTEDIQKQKENLPPISIVLYAHEQTTTLAQNLPVLLEQTYPSSYQVIVVTDKDNLGTEDLMKQLCSKYPHLYVIYLPTSSRYMSRRKLAITLGVKAAQTEWIVITDPTCKPHHTNWLTAMAYHFNDSVGFVMGYTALSNDTPKSWQFEHAMQAYHRLCAAKHQHAWSTNSPNIALRKSMFMENDGFRNNLRFARGEYDFLVNEYACKTTTDIAIAKEEWLYEDEQSKEEWRNLHTNFLAIRSKLHGHIGYRTKMFFYSLLPYISIIISFLGIAGGIMQQQWVLLCASVLALLLLIILRTLLAKRVNKLLENPIGTASLFFHEIAYCWHSISYRFQYCRADKVSFSSHKL